jgi:beta-glucosidase
VQVDLLESVLDVNPRVVVVLSNGSVVRLPFADRVPALVEGWLLGQAGGPATADVLTGRVNPSGRLSETIPHRLADNPAYLDFPGEDLHVRYAEGIFVGHRWYDARDLDVAFPFGHGLSYTTFGYDGLTATMHDDGLRVTLTVTNTGDLPGREVVQCYLGRDVSAVRRPPRVLAAFDGTPYAPLVPLARRLAVTGTRQHRHDLTRHRLLGDPAHVAGEAPQQHRAERLRRPAEHRTIERLGAFGVRRA